MARGRTFAERCGSGGRSPRTRRRAPHRSGIHRRRRSARPRSDGATVGSGERERPSHPETSAESDATTIPRAPPPHPPKGAVLGSCGDGQERASRANRQAKAAVPLKRRRPGTLSPPRRRPGQGGPDLRTRVAVPAGAGDRRREEAQRRCRARISRALAPRGIRARRRAARRLRRPRPAGASDRASPKRARTAARASSFQPAVGTAHPGQGISEAHDEHEPWYRRRVRRTERTRARERASPPMRTAPRKPCQSNGRATASRELGSGATAVLSLPRTSPRAGILSRGTFMAWSVPTPYSCDQRRSDRVYRNAEGRQLTFAYHARSGTPTESRAGLDFERLLAAGLIVGRQAIPLLRRAGDD